jgi:hypothetical protein
VIYAGHEQWRLRTASGVLFQPLRFHQATSLPAD